MQDKTIGILIIVLSLLALSFVFFINVFVSLDSLNDPLVGNGLGKLCSSPENCQNFCNNNKGRCNDYCRENPTNNLCNKL